VEQLQVSLASDYSSNTHAWLQQLYDGSEESTHAAMDLQHPLLQQQQQLQQHISGSNGVQPSSVHPGTGSSSSSNGNDNGNHHQQHLHTAHNVHSQSGGGSSEQQQQQQHSAPAVADAVLQRLMDVVRYNAYGDRHDDLAAAALAEQQPVALLGLWPEFSLLNHSCVPNAINWVLPGAARAMVVRAARHIAPGACSRRWAACGRARLSAGRIHCCGEEQHIWVRCSAEVDVEYMVCASAMRSCITRLVDSGG
jgi:hypothetical protein